MGELKLTGGLKVGKVNFINTLPIFYPLESGAVQHDFDIVGATPSALNALLDSGQIDLGVVSSIEYGRNFEKYLLLPDLSISCTSRVCSVLLLSAVPLQQLHGREILLTPKSHTSIALLKLLFSRRFKITPHYRVTDYHMDGSSWPDGAKAVLAIGDDALRLQKSPTVNLTLDLGAAWHEWTKHPFVFAVWALRHGSLANRDGQLHQAHATLLEARDYGLNHLEDIATTVGRSSWFSRQECLQYLQTIEYDLDSDKQAGLRLFFDMLYEAGELSRRVSLNFLPRVPSETGKKEIRGQKSEVRIQTTDDRNRFERFQRLERRTKEYGPRTSSDWIMVKKLLLILRMIKIEHTVFALPFAFMGAFLAARGWPSSRQILWILLAMVGIRSAAMAFNRLVDANIDCANRRTRNREIPRGALEKIEVSVFVAISSVVFILAAYQLNRLCFIFSPVALAFTFFYSFTKRFTWLSHLFLGAAIGLAPVGGWLAVAGSFHPIAFLLGAAVLFWIGGFDIVYACQDYAFDCNHMLKSIPQRWGIARALKISEFCHLITFGLLVTVGSMAGLGPAYYLGLVLILVFLITQHLIVSAEDLSKVNLSFFTMNGLISMVIFAATILSL